MPHAPNIADLINAKRAGGYDGKFEALLREPWYCPNCKAAKTILDVAIPAPGSCEVRTELCSDCGQPGIQHLAGNGMKQFSKLLDCIAPFDRSGTA